MDAAVMTTEDGRFRLHQGFDHEAIRNSVRENLKAGKFLRGASTISMQLAKNLYLDRTKNLSRKLQELILTMYLEQALTKDQILALYLNVIEFGPMIYGIGPASEHYFKTAASELSVSQAMYLSSILPNPKRQYFGAGGKVTPSHTKYLHRLIRIAGKMHWLSQDEVERGVRETPVLGLPQPERSEPDFGDEDGQGEAADEGP
jgi:membrane peptidoglycan carboxypeptidase